MSKIAHYLQEHLEGEVTASLETRRHFATDGSIFKSLPAVIVYPRNEDDIRKTLRFSRQLAERDHKLSITARGGGTDVSGAAIGSGIVLVFGPHMDRVTILNPRKQTVTVEPGLNYDKLQQMLYTHGLSLPPYPTGYKATTLGGTIAGNASGEKSVKYGDTSQYLEKLRVVLASGDTIEVHELTKSQLSQKLGLTSFEGEIYRQLDALLEENAELLAKAKSKLSGVPRNVAGLNLFDVRHGSSFNLLPLLAGSQGTLAITTEATIRLVQHSLTSKMVLVSLGRLSSLDRLLPDILKLRPSICDFINRAAIEQVTAVSPAYFSGSLELPKAAIHLLVEFDDRREGNQKKSVDKLCKLVGSAGGDYQVAKDLTEQDAMRRIIGSVNVLNLSGDGRSAPIPVADAAVTPVKLASFLEKAANLLKAAGLAPAMWGRAGEGVVVIQPVLDLSQLGDRQKLFKLGDSIYKLVGDMGGTITATAGDGRLRAPKLEQFYGKKIYDLMREVKKIFDPHNILNPGVKFGTTDKDIKMLLSAPYRPHHKFDHPAL